MEGTAHAAELQVTENLHAQLALGLQDLPFSEQHYVEWTHSCMPPSWTANAGLPMLPSSAK